MTLDPERDRAVTHATRALAAARAAWRHAQPSRPAPERFPARDPLDRAVRLLAEALFPARLGRFRGDAAAEDGFVADRIATALDLIAGEVEQELAYWHDVQGLVAEPGRAGEVVRLFAGTLSRIRSLLDTDVAAIFRGDPAARSVDEILICYPGATAILHHRIAHELDSLGAPIVARIVSELANERTGIDIHPGATIGPSFFIDHGTGVVIGETAVIGARVRLYQHVTLGGRGRRPNGHEPPRGPLAEREARHPIIGDDVLIYAGATILGRVRIGDRTVIGGNVWLLSDVAPGSLVLQPEAVVTKR
ncbi:serine O-acetyltransferase EpsC [Sphingomonas sp. VNH70]|uniref:serine O-acetyltransferase EpsC n=1 Tax=Sphingomonas silueang TaxID=3156617 RepID=UPI0032B5E75B